MPATLVPEAVIPDLAARVTSDFMLQALRDVEESHFILNDESLDPETADILGQLADAGLVDVAYQDAEWGAVIHWLSNHNGRRVLRHYRAEPLRQVAVS